MQHSDGGSNSPVITCVQTDFHHFCWLDRARGLRTAEVITYFKPRVLVIDTRYKERSLIERTEQSESTMICDFQYISLG